VNSVIRPSISKINVDTYVNSNEYTMYAINDVFDSFLHYIDMTISSKTEKVIYNRSGDVHCFVYNYGNQVDWKDLVEEIIGKKTQDELFFFTKYPSFILIINLDENIYCITGGLANHLISDFKDKVFGVNLICKIVEPTDEIIRYIADKRVYGRINSSRITNRTASNFYSERNYESIFSEFGTIIKNQIQERLGISIQKDNDGNEVEKGVLVNFGSTIRIGKPSTIQEILDITRKINELMDDSIPFKFVINFLVPVDRIGIKQSDVFDEFYKNIIIHPDNLNIGYNFELNNLIDIERFRNNNNKNIDSKFLEKYSIKSMNSLNDLRNLLVNHITENKSIGIINNYYFKFESGEYEKNKVRIKDLLDQEYLYKNEIQVYLIEGVWYRFLGEYVGYLDNEFKKLFDDSAIICEKIFGVGEIDIDFKSFTNEELLKKKIKTSENLLDSDMKYIKSVEIADAIYLKDNSIYLLHNKTKFDGAKIRDITGQISTSAKFLSTARSNDVTLAKDMNDYIAKLRIANPQKNEIVDEFERLLRDSSSSVTYMASFTSKVERDTKSNYVKYLLYITKKHLRLNNYNFFIN